MKTFDEVAFDYEQCRSEFEEFRQLLAGRDELAEAADVLPFFKGRRQLSVLLGMFNPRIAWADRIAYEFNVFGDFACDLAVGEWNTGSYCLVEFENAEKNSVFERRGKKATREWAQRFDHGFSQIVDWCHKLHDRANSHDFLARFGRHTIDYEAVLVVGRDRHLDAGERARLEWRTNYVTVNSKKVHCLTFDQLLAQLATRIDLLSLVAQAVRPPESPNPPEAAVAPPTSPPATQGEAADVR